MIYVIALATLVYIFSENTKGDSVVSLAWAMIAVAYILNITAISLETIVVALMVFFTLVTSTYYQLYFNQVKDTKLPSSKLVNSLVLASVLLMFGSLLITFRNNLEMINELLADDKIRVVTIFQFFEHYRIWGTALGALVIFYFLLTTLAKKRGFEVE